MGVALLFVIVVLAFGIGIYNKLIQRRVHVEEAWSGIDVQLKRRHDLIPNLVATVKGYMQHERGLLEKVTQLRSQASGVNNVKQRSELENSLTQTLKSIFAVAEAYPDLKANQGFLDLHKSLIHVEDDIQLARRYYNGTVRNYNVLVQTVPSNMISNMFHFQAAEFFQVDTAGERSVPKVNI